MSGDAQAHLVDLDDALITWAMDKLGSDYTVEKVDASKVRPPSTSLPHTTYLPIAYLPSRPSTRVLGREGRLKGRPITLPPTAHYLPPYHPLPTSLPPTAYLPTAHCLPPYTTHCLPPYHPAPISIVPNFLPTQVHGREGQRLKGRPMTLPPYC